MVVLKDCNIEETVATCVQARFQNTGQSCIAGKRLLLDAAIAEPFIEQLVVAVRELKSGDPSEKDTYIGTLAREDLAKDDARFSIVYFFARSKKINIPGLSVFGK